MEAFLLAKISAYSTKLEEIWAKYKKEFAGDWLKIVQQLALQSFDVLWIEHIDTMDELRRGIGLRGYGGRDPLVEYKNEARLMFDRLINEIWSALAQRLERIEIKRKPTALHRPTSRPRIATERSEDSTANLGQETDQSTINQSTNQPLSSPDAGRRQPCRT